MTSEVTSTNITRTLNASTDIVLASENSKCVSTEPPKEVTAVKREYSIVGDAFYAGVNSDVAPQWLTDTITGVVESSVADGLSDYNSVVQNIRDAIDSIDVAKNTFVETVNFSSTVDGIIGARLDTLNATYDGKFATKVGLDTVVANSEFALASSVNDLRAEFNEDISSRITDVTQVFSDATSSNADSILALTTAFADQELNLSGVADAVTGIQTYVGLSDEDGNPNGTGILGRLSLVEKQTDGVIEYTTSTYDVMEGVDESDPNVNDDKLRTDALPYATWTVIKGTGVPVATTRTCKDYAVVPPASIQVGILDGTYYERDDYTDSDLDRYYKFSNNSWTSVLESEYFLGRESLRSAHTADVYIQYSVNSDGVKSYLKGYKFIKSAIDNTSPYSTDAEGYGWALISDTDTQSAYIAALNAKDLADSKRRVFVSQPFPPYDEGDLWINSTVSPKVLMSSGTSVPVGGTFSLGHWTIADEQVQDFVATIYNPESAGVRRQLDGKVEYFFYEKFTDISGATSESTALDIIDNSWNTKELRDDANGNVVYFKDTKNAYWYQASTPAWLSVTDTSIYQALQDASKAQGAADGKVSHLFAWGGNSAPADYTVEDSNGQVLEVVDSSHVLYWYTEGILFSKGPTGWSDKVAVPTSPGGEAYVSDGDILTVLDTATGDLTVFTFNGVSWQKSSASGIVSKSKWFVDLDNDVRGSSGLVASALNDLEVSGKAYADASSLEVESKFAYNSTVILAGSMYKAGFGLDTTGSVQIGTDSTTGDPVYSSKFWVNAKTFTLKNPDYPNIEASFTVTNTGITLGVEHTEATRNEVKGPHAASNTYLKGDVVTVDGSSYMALLNVPAGIPIGNATYWVLFAEKGSTGAYTDYLFARKGTQPLNPGGSDTWYTDVTDVPSGSGKLWSIKKVVGAGGSPTAYSDIRVIDSPIVREVTIYSNPTTGSAPSLPNSSYNLTNNTLTVGSSNWSLGIKSITANNQKVYATTALVLGNSTQNSVAVAWSSPAVYSHRVDGISPDALTVTTTAQAGGTLLEFSNGTSATIPNGESSGVKIIYAYDPSGSGASFSKGSRTYVNYYEWTGSAPTSVPAGLTYTLFEGKDGDSSGVLPIYADSPTGSNATFSFNGQSFVNFYEWDTTAPATVPPGLTYVKFVGDDGANGVSGADGVSIIWKGAFASHPSSPQNGWAYKNTSNGTSYVHQDGAWYVMAIDGQRGADGLDGINGASGNDGLDIVWKGDSSSPPSSPVKNWVYRDTDNGLVYIYNGSAWELMVADGNNGVDGASGSDGSDGLSVYITYHTSSVSSQPSTPSGSGTSGGWTTNPSSSANWMSQKIASSASSGSWGSPILITGRDGINGTNGLNGVNGTDGRDGLDIVWKGDSATPPSSPVKNWTYRDTDNGQVYIYNGSSWVLMVADGNDGVNGTNGSNGLSVYITYHSNAVSTSPSTPTGSGTGGGWTTTPSSTANWLSQKVASSASSGSWGAPILIAGRDGIDGRDGYSNLLRAADHWVVGTSGSQGVFTRNGVTSENRVVLGAGPLGVSEPIWEADGVGNDADGGWNATISGINHTKTYRSCVWMKQGSNSMSMYLGCSGISTVYLNGSTNSNPYFWSGDLPSLNKWYLVVGIIHGSGYTGGDTGVSGIYDPVTGNKVIDAAEYKNRANVTTQIHRAYRYYASSSAKAYFARPRFEEVNGEEYSIQEILGRKAVDGQDGADGVSYAGTSEYYKLTNSTTSPSNGGSTGSGWSSTVQTPTASNKYLWNYNVNRKSDGSTSISPVSLITQYVSDGRGIQSISEAYKISNSSTTPPSGTYAATFSGAGSMSAAYPFMWNRTTTAFTDGSPNHVVFNLIAARGNDGARGLQGLQGADGLDGVPGAAGVSTYFHIAYADNASGGGFSQSPTNKKYIGTYVDSVQTDAASGSALWKWQLVKGADGLNGSNGVAGTNGSNGQTSYFHVAYANNSTGSSGFSTTDPSNKTYIGTYTDFTLADSNTPSKYKWQLVKGTNGINGTNGAVGPKGADGVSTYFHIAYADNASGGGFSQNPTGKAYIGTYVNTTQSDAGSGSSLWKWQLVRGANGANGAQGIPGKDGVNGQTHYLHIAYSNSSDGTVGFSTTDATNKSYIGQYTDFTINDSNTPSKYAWTKIKGENGSDGSDGSDGVRGATVLQYAGNLGNTAPGSVSSSSLAGYWNASASSAYAVEIAGDSLVVTNTNTTSGWTHIFEYNGSSWSGHSTFVVNGNQIVKGTVNADAIIANTTMRSPKIEFVGDQYMRISAAEGFGSNNQFIEWFGKNKLLGGATVNYSALTESNAITYLKTNGDAYFGGSIISGTLSNGLTSSTLAPDSSITIGPFGTNGGDIVLNCSVSMLAVYSRIQNGPGSTPPTPSVILTLEENVSGVWYQRKSEAFTGTASGRSFPEGGGQYAVEKRQSLVKSFTYTDNSRRTANRTFRAKISGRTNFFTLSPWVTSQYVSINSREE